MTVAHLDNKMYLLGYLPKINKLFLADKSFNVVAYTLHVAIINYQTAVGGARERVCEQALTAVCVFVGAAWRPQDG